MTHQKKAHLHGRCAFFSYIRLRRVLLLRSDIRLSPSDIRFASFGGELLNITTAYADIIDIIVFLKLPQNSLYVIDFSITIKDADKPVIIHQLSVTPQLDKIHHRCFEYFDGKLTEKDHPFEIVETKKIKQSSHKIGELQ